MQHNNANPSPPEYKSEFVEEYVKPPNGAAPEFLAFPDDDAPPPYKWPEAEVAENHLGNAMNKSNNFENKEIVTFFDENKIISFKRIRDLLNRPQFVKGFNDMTGAFLARNPNEQGMIAATMASFMFVKILEEKAKNCNILPLFDDKLVLSFNKKKKFSYNKDVFRDTSGGVGIVWKIIEDLENKSNHNEFIVIKVGNDDTKITYMIKHDIYGIIIIKEVTLKISFCDLTINGCYVPTKRKKLTTPENISREIDHWLIKEFDIANKKNVKVIGCVAGLIRDRYYEFKIGSAKAQMEAHRFSASVNLARAQGQNSQLTEFEQQVEESKQIFQFATANSKILDLACDTIFRKGPLEKYKIESWDIQKGKDATFYVPNREEDWFEALATIKHFEKLGNEIMQDCKCAMVLSVGKDHAQIFCGEGGQDPRIGIHNFGLNYHKQLYNAANEKSEMSFRQTSSFFLDFGDNFSALVRILTSSTCSGIALKSGFALLLDKSPEIWNYIINYKL
jgi:hypothetical protein